MQKISRLEKQISVIEDDNKKMIEQMNEDITRQRITTTAFKRFNNEKLSSKEEELILLVEQNPNKYFLANFFLTICKNRKEYKDDDLNED